MNKCIELLPCDWLIRYLCKEAVGQVELIKRLLSVSGELKRSIKMIIGRVGLLNWNVASQPKCLHSIFFLV